MPQNQLVTGSDFAAFFCLDLVGQLQNQLPGFLISSWVTSATLSGTYPRNNHDNGNQTTVRAHRRGSGALRR